MAEEQAGVDLAKQLGGALLTFNGTQHTVVFQGEKCVDDYAAAFEAVEARRSTRRVIVQVAPEVRG